MVSSDQALILAAKGAEIRIVLLLTSVTSGEAILANPEVGDIEGLVGRRITYAAGTDSELLLRGTLTANNVPVTKVELVRTGGRSPSELLLEGTVDAAVEREPEVIAAQATDDGLEVIATAGDQPGLLSTVLVVREETAAERPGQLLGFIRAWQDLYLFERDRLDVVATGIAAMQDVSVEDATMELTGIGLYDISANAIDLFPGGAYYDQTLTQIDAAATAAGWLPAPVDARALIDGAFAQTVATAR